MVRHIKNVLAILRRDLSLWVFPRRVLLDYCSPGQGAVSINEGGRLVTYYRGPQFTRVWVGYPLPFELEKIWRRDDGR